VVISQPPGQKCAVVGGIMGVRMVKRGVKAVVVDGRVRDLETLRGVGVPVSLGVFCLAFGFEILRLGSLLITELKQKG
jgi:regulator of RNase E activity RraA